MSENAHLLCYSHLESLRRTFLYASFLGISNVLHLIIFRQPRNVCYSARPLIWPARKGEYQREETHHSIREREMNPQELIRRYGKDEIIFEENSVGDEMFVVHSGRVRLVTKAPGTDLMLGMLGPGAFFGEMALVDDAPRSATASAAEDNTKLLVLNQSRFLYLVSQQPPFALTIMQGLCQRIRERWNLYSKLTSSS